MNRWINHGLACAVLAASGVAQAEVVTLTVGQQADDWRVPGGSVTFQVSKMLITEFNLTKAKVTELSPADLTLNTSSSTSSTGLVSTRYVSGQLAAPLTSITGDWVEDNAVTVQALQSAGGFTLSTLKNGATLGAGSLSVSNIRVDLQTKKVFADIQGANGVGALDDYHLWSFAAQSDPLVLTRDGFLTPGYTYSSNQVSTSGLFASTAALDMIQKALNLNNVGRSALNSMNDPTRNGAGGFGYLTMTAVPEPSAIALAVAGLLAAGLLGRLRRVPADAGQG